MRDERCQVCCGLRLDRYKLDRSAHAHTCVRAEAWQKVRQEQQCIEEPLQIRQFVVKTLCTRVHY